MNIQHSCRTDEWGTPDDILDRVRRVLGGIDLDPASDANFNIRVKARHYLTDGLETEWPDVMNVFLNPPGGKLGKFSKTGLFWKRLMHFRALQKYGHAIWMGFSLEQLAVGQNYGAAPLSSFPFCIPRKRIAFIQTDGQVGGAPSHSNVIVYVPCRIDCTPTFKDAFRDLGHVVIPRKDI